MHWGHRPAETCARCPASRGPTLSTVAQTPLVSVALGGRGFLPATLLRCNSHTVRFAHCKCTVQASLLYSELCHHRRHQSKNIFIPPQRKPSAECTQPPVPRQSLLLRASAWVCLDLDFSGTLGSARRPVIRFAPSAVFAGWPVAQQRVFSPVGGLRALSPSSLAGPLGCFAP